MYLTRARTLPSSFQAERQRLAARFVKDEFESMADFQARIGAHNARVRDLNDRIRAFLESAPTRPPASALGAIMAGSLRAAYGSPSLANVSYDADAEVFLADLEPAAAADLGVPRRVALRVPRLQARGLKPRLVASAPVITFEVTAEGTLRYSSAHLELDGKKLALEATDATQIAAAPVPVVTVLAPAAPAAQSSDWVVPQVSIALDPGVARLEKEVLARERDQALQEATRRQKADLEARLARLTSTSVEGGPDDLGPRLAKGTATPDPHRYAFVVGVSTYDSVAPVSFADRAAELFGRFATARLGVPESQTVVLTNGKATGTAIKGRLKGLLNRVQRGDTVYVYYAGHGLPGRDGNGTYLVPSDCVEGSYEDPDLRLDAVCAALESTGAGRIVVVLDACFAGKSGPKDLLFKGVAPVRIVAKGPTIDPARTTLLLASGAEQFANEYRDRSNRLFSYWLLKGLMDRPDDLAAAFTRARVEVDRLSRVRGVAYTQTPELVGRAEL
jgi:hypothetical protein